MKEISLVHRHLGFEGCSAASVVEVREVGKKLT